jgi:hypothetical protein
MAMLNNQRVYANLYRCTVLDDVYELGWLSQQFQNTAFYDIWLQQPQETSRNPTVLQTLKSRVVDSDSDIRLMPKQSRNCLLANLCRCS